MCGIVGYLGKNKAQDFLISGLKRLEYRGYDSAGISTVDENGHATTLRAKGKITALEQKVAKSPRADTLGIGHTRWATHGEPSESNAHPHAAGRIILVHNGIIENYRELKDQLKNYQFTSDTDSEVLAALIDHFYTDDLTAAVTQALQLVQGTYGIAVMATDQTTDQTTADQPTSQNTDRPAPQIVVARQGSPLIIGVGTDETFIASDAAALVGRTSRAIYLQDGEIATITPDNITLQNLAARQLSPQVETIQADLTTIQKGNYPHFLLKEIMEQPNALLETIRGRIIDNEVHLGGLNLSATELRKIKHLIIVGCGTAHYAGLLAMYYLEQLIPDLSVECVVASEYRYRGAHVPDDSVALFVSQSGETADTLACVRLLKKQGVWTLGVVNVVGSTIAREVDGGIYVHAGPEISVASTKAFTAQIAALIMFGLTLARNRYGRSELATRYTRELTALTEQLEFALQTLPATAEKLAQQYTDYDHAIYLGRGTAYPIALEGALKLKEISYIDANAYPAGELKHGPLALIDDRFFTVVFVPAGELLAKTVSNVQEVLARGGHVIAVTDSDDFDLAVEHVVKITTPTRDGNHLTPVIMNLFSQLFAYYIAAKKGVDVDQPRNLAKSVTVE